MADCTLSFNFVKPPARVQPGEELQGEVVVRVDSACKCDGLTVAAEWDTSGKGNRATGQAEVVKLFTGQWEPGEHRYRFSYKAPVGPLSYDGELLNIHWNLLARADVPWAIDPKAQQPFVLTAAAGEGTPYFFGPLYKPPDPATWGVSETAGGGKLVKQPMGLGTKLVIGAFILLFGGGMIFALPALAILLAPFALFFLVRHLMVKSKLGIPEVKVFPNPARPSEEFNVLARVQPQKEVKLGKVYAELIGQERVVSGSGKHARTHLHPLHSYRHSFPVEQREVRAGEHLELRARIILPPNAPLTFSAMSNNVEWNVKLSIELLGWPDFEKTLPLTVRPGAVPQLAGGFALRD